ncbi:hypothetical protein BJY04DRAFT_223166 [Aspergillus karnatakaensis]|uniref:uncharacterized protein n=1 Tax=Aspergillus karnatakaensis TaxID=1810916 RepID=UPI003CCCB679
MASNSYDRFTWQETSPGRWERDIDEVEEKYTSLAKAYSGTGRVFVAMTGFISFSVSIPTGATREETEERVEKALRLAWLRLRHDHPTIRARVTYDDAAGRYRKVYETLADPAALKSWLDETFRVVSEGVTGIEWCNSDPPMPAFPTLFLVKTPSAGGDVIRADLAFRIRHDIIDGMGTLILFNNLFKHAAEAYKQQSAYITPRFGDEWVNLSPPLRVAASIPPTLTPEHEVHMKETLAFNASLRENVEVASLPFKTENPIPGKHLRVAITLPAEETSKVLAKCRSAGLSITHAYHAAIALAVRDAQERKESTRTVRYISYSLINERAHCDSPYSTSAHPAALYHSVSGKSLAIDLTIPSASDSSTTQCETFAEIAQQVRAFYVDIRDNPEHIFLVPSYWAMGVLPYPGDGVPPIPARNEAPSVSVSSMGVIDKVIAHRHGDFELENPWVTGEELGTGLGVFLDTWKGRLTLSAAYNEAWHGEEEVLGYLRRCNEIVKQGLGV